MESNFERIDRCILGFFSNAQETATCTLEDCAVFHHELKECYSEFRKTVIYFVINADEHRKVEYRIQQVQCQLVNLADHIETFLSSKKSIKKDSSHYKDACNAATRQVEEMLTFLEQNFSRFINMEEKVPAGYKRLLQREMKKRIKFLKTFITSLGLENEYLSLIMQPAEALLDPDNSKNFSYHDMWYLKRMYEDLYNVFKNQLSGNSFNKMTGFLVSINFNSAFFLEYFTNHINLSVTNVGNLNAKIEKLYWWQKELGQMYQSYTDSFIPQMPGAKQSILKWLKEEIKYQEKSQQLSLLLPQQKEVLPGDAPLLTSLSVEQLSCFLKVLFDKKIIYHPNMQEMIDFFASNIRTKNTSRVSAKSLRNNLYGISKAIIEDNVTMLISMVNHTRTLDKN